MEPSSVCEVCGLPESQRHGRRPVHVVARSPAMQAIMRRVSRIAPSDAPVLVGGESGSGKEVIARALHAGSGRRDAPFVAINCAALPAELLESELFGHARGSFSGAVAARRGLFEEAEGGTLFLDEIGEMPAGLQAKLLRALQDGEIRRVGENRPVATDVRIVAASNRDLAGLVASGGFRSDLYYRLKVFSIDVPPLRERPEDVLPLALLHLKAHRPDAAFSADARAALLGYPWPGNVRELLNAVRHAAVLAEGEHIEPGDLPPEIGGSSNRVQASVPAAPEQNAHLGAFSPEARLDEVVGAHVRAALERFGGNQTAAARSLGVGRNTLWRWLKAS